MNRIAMNWKTIGFHTFWRIEVSSTDINSIMGTTKLRRFFKCQLPFFLTKLPSDSIWILLAWTQGIARKSHGDELTDSQKPHENPTVSEFPKSQVWLKQTLYYTHTVCLLYIASIHIYTWLEVAFGVPSGWKRVPIHLRFDFNWKPFQGVGSRIYIYTHTFYTYYVICMSISMRLLKLPNTSVEIIPTSEASEGNFHQKFWLCEMTSSCTQVRFLSLIWRLSIHNICFFYGGQWTQHHVDPDFPKHHLCTSQWIWWMMTDACL